MNHVFGDRLVGSRPLRHDPEGDDGPSPSAVLLRNLDRGTQVMIGRGGGEQHEFVAEEDATIGDPVESLAQGVEHPSQGVLERDGVTIGVANQRPPFLDVVTAHPLCGCGQFCERYVLERHLGEMSHGMVASDAPDPVEPMSRILPRSYFPVAFFGSSSRKMTRFGTLKSASRSLQCSRNCSSVATPGGETTATTASPQCSSGSPTTTASRIRSRVRIARSTSNGSTL